jgi:hypothetical protein
MHLPGRSRERLRRPSNPRKRAFRSPLSGRCHRRCRRRAGWARPDGFPSREGRHLLGGADGMAARGWRSSSAHGGQEALTCGLGGDAGDTGVQWSTARDLGAAVARLQPWRWRLECCMIEFLVSAAGYLRAE